MQAPGLLDAETAISNDHFFAEFLRSIQWVAPRVALALCWGVTLVACHDAPTHTIQPLYDTRGKLRLLVFDSDRNGRPDMWSYMNGSSVVRIEIDANGDGVVDRWEYYGANRAIEKVGTSRLDNGTVDTWSYPNAAGQTGRVERSTSSDGRITRTEFHENGSLARAEEDADGDGAVDRWETYVKGYLRSVAFDFEGKGRPTRSLTYADNGEVVAARVPVEAVP
jgi:hypothetical protein